MKGKWLEDKTVYQIWPRSFCDSNGDGIGDIGGIISRLDHISGLGAEIIWLSPLYVSPNEDFGYDIADYTDINPEFGTLEDFDRLVAEADKRGIKIIMDLVINHTSTQHKWFEASIDPNSEFHKYYFWRKGRTTRSGKRKPPNNWTSLFGGSAWEYCAQNDMFYLHLFAKGQADLDLGFPPLFEQIKQVMRFWLDRGVVGFRCDVINMIGKTTLANGKRSLALVGREHYLSQPCCYEMLDRLKREVIDDYPDTFMVGESVMASTADANKLCRYLDMIFEFERMSADNWLGIKYLVRRFKPKRLLDIITKWQTAVDWNANYFENHDQPRSLSRYVPAEWQEKGGKLLAMLLIMLRGTPYIYQGQEIGMTNCHFELDEYADVECRGVYQILRKLPIGKERVKRMIAYGSRDNARTPMQWNSSPGAGFTSGTPWIKINPNHERINVLRQQNNPDSLLHFYRSLIELRKKIPALHSGGFRVKYARKNVYIFERFIDDECYQIALNFDAKTATLPFALDGQIIIDNYVDPKLSTLLHPFEAVLLRVGDRHGRIRTKLTLE